MNYKLGQNLIEWSFKIKQECLIVWSEVLDDPNPIHLNKNKVKDLGLGNNCINQGPANVAYIINCISKNFHKFELVSIKNKFKGNVFSGDNVTVTGLISSVNNCDETIYLTLDLYLNTQNKKGVVESTAVIKIP